MGRLLPLRSETRPRPGDGASVLSIGDDHAGDVVEAIAAETTREVLATVYEEPATASEVADRVGTSLQNVSYHLEKLQDVGLVEVGDTWYSAQGNEMKVYAPTNESVVLFAGDETTRSTLRETLRRVLGAGGLLAAGALLVDRVVQVPGPAVFHTSGSGEDGFDLDGHSFAARDPDPTLLPTVELGGWLTPGTLFLLGGLVALAAVVAWAWVGTRR